MVGASADNADAYPVALVPAGESIDDVDAVARVEEVNGTLAIDAPDLERRLVASKIKTHVGDFQMRATLKPPCNRMRGRHAPRGKDAESSSIGCMPSVV